jgi:hypothetical protein
MDSLPFYKVSFQDAVTSPKTEPAHVPEADPPGGQKPRHGAPGSQSAKLSLQACLWIDALPPDMRPHALARFYPRIANRLAGVWKSELQCEECLDELMLDGRGDRCGFPVAVAAELATLKAHRIATATTVRYDVWGNRLNPG